MDICHDRERQRFVINLEADEAVLEYQWLSDSEVNFSRTYVPNRFRGQGYAEGLVKTGLAWARGQQLHVEASCWYVRDFL